MAIQFSSKCRGGWSPDRLTSYVKADVLSALESRWATHVAYMQMQSTLFDILSFARRTKAYRALQSYPSDTLAEKLAILRQIALARGPLSSIRTEILRTVAWLEGMKSELDLFSEGWVEVAEKKSKEIKIKLLGHRRSNHLTCEEMRARALEFSRALSMTNDMLRKARDKIEILP